MAGCSLRGQRHLAAVLGCLVVALAGSDYLAAVLANDLKTEYLLEQQPVEIIVGLGSVAANLGYPWGLLLERLSARTGFILSTVIGTVSGLLLFTADYTHSFYSTHWWLLALYWVGICTAFILYFLLSSAVLLGNYPVRRHGLIMGVIMTTFWAGQILFTSIYIPIQSDEVGDSKPPRVGYICLLVALCNLVFGSLSAKYVLPLPLEDDSEEKYLMEKSNVVEGCDEARVQGSGRCRCCTVWMEHMGVNRLWDLDFHLILWGFVLSISVANTYIDNVSIIGETVGLEDVEGTLLLVSYGIGMLLALTCGYLSDLTLPYFPRAVYVIISSFIQGFMCSIFVGYGMNQPVFIVTTPVVFANAGLHMSLVGSILHERFGQKHFKRDWGLILMLSALVTLALLVLFGSLYEHAISQEGSQDCMGLHCLKVIFIVSVVLSFIAVGLFLLLIRQKLRRNIERN